MGKGAQYSRLVRSDVAAMTVTALCGPPPCGGLIRSVDMPTFCGFSESPMASLSRLHVESQAPGYPVETQIDPVDALTSFKRTLISLSVLENESTQQGSIPSESRFCSSWSESRAQSYAPYRPILQFPKIVLV